MSAAGSAKVELSVRLSHFPQQLRKLYGTDKMRKSSAMCHEGRPSDALPTCNSLQSADVERRC